MQADLLAANPATKIRILGVNEIGHESGNPAITTGRNLPWLQDVAGQDAWTKWAPVLRDVIILDTANIKQAVYNLTVNDLAITANYNALKALLKSVAGE